jgi:hypothetical protein
MSGMMLNISANWYVWMSPMPLLARGCSLNDLTSTSLNSVFLIISSGK